MCVLSRSANGILADMNSTAPLRELRADKLRRAVQAAPRHEPGVSAEYWHLDTWRE